MNLLCSRPCPTIGINPFQACSTLDDSKEDMSAVVPPSRVFASIFYVSIDVKSRDLRWIEAPIYFALFILADCIR